MENLSALPLSLQTLLATSFLPFLYFFYRRQYRYRPDLVKMWDFILTMASLLVMAIVMVNLAKLGEGWRDRDLVLLNILHLMPSFLCFMILSLTAQHSRAQVQQGRERGEHDGQEITPVPINSGVEKIGWNDLVIDKELRDELVSVAELLRDPKTTKKYGIEIPKGILFSGPPGTGKTTIAKVMANAAGLSFFAVRHDEVVSKWWGDSEKNLSRLFDAAQKYAPSLLFIDEIDSIGKTRSGEQAHTDNLLNHLLQLIDGVVKTEGIYIIGATNRPDLVDEALKRAGRLNRVIIIPRPDFDARQKLFQLYLSKLSLQEDLDLRVLAEITEGKSGADIKAICNQAGLNAFKRESGQKKRDFVVTHEDMKAALSAFL